VQIQVDIGIGNFDAIDRVGGHFMDDNYLLVHQRGRLQSDVLACPKLIGERVIALPPKPDSLLHFHTLLPSSSCNGLSAPLSQKSP